MTRNFEIKLLADCVETIPQLSELQYEEITRHWVPGSSIEGVSQKLMGHANRDQLPLTFVAIIDEQSIGMASLRITDGIQPELSPWLGGLVVDPAYRGKGVGEALINQIKQEALLRHYQVLYLLAFDPTIPKWYSRLGWESIGRDQLFGHAVAVMQKNLQNGKENK